MHSTVSGSLSFPHLWETEFGFEYSKQVVLSKCVRFKTLYSSLIISPYVNSRNCRTALKIYYRQYISQIEEEVYGENDHISEEVGLMKRLKEAFYPKSDTPCLGKFACEEKINCDRRAKSDCESQILKKRTMSNLLGKEKAPIRNKKRSKRKKRKMMFQRDLLRKKKRLCNKYKGLNRKMKHRLSVSRNFDPHSLVRTAEFREEETKSDKGYEGVNQRIHKHLRRSSKNEVLKQPLFNNLMFKRVEGNTLEHKANLKRLNVKGSLRRRARRPHTSMDNNDKTPKIMIFPQCSKDDLRRSFSKPFEELRVSSIKRISPFGAIELTNSLQQNESRTFLKRNIPDGPKEFKIRPKKNSLKGSISRVSERKDDSSMQEMLNTQGKDLGDAASEARTEPKKPSSVQDKLAKLSIIDHFKDLSIKEKIRKRKERRLKNQKSSSSIIMLKKKTHNAALQTDIPQDQVPDKIEEPKHQEFIKEEGSEKILKPTLHKGSSVQVHQPKLSTLKLAGYKSFVPKLNLDNIRKPFSYLATGIEQECILGESLSNYSLSSVRMANMWRPVNVFEEHMQNCLRNANNLVLLEDGSNFDRDFDQALDCLFEPQSVIIEDKIFQRDKRDQPENAIFDQKWKKLNKRKKLITFSGNNIMFQDDFEKPIEFLSTSYYQRKNNIRESFGSRKSNPIRKFTHSKEYRKSKTHLKPIQKVSTIFINGQEYSIPELTINKFQRRGGYNDSNWAKSRRAEYCKSNSNRQTKRFQRMKSFSDKAKKMTNNINLSVNAGSKFIEKKFTQKPTLAKYDLKQTTQVLNKIMQLQAIKEEDKRITEESKSNSASNSFVSTYNGEGEEEEDEVGELDGSHKFVKRPIRTRQSMNTPIAIESSIGGKRAQIRRTVTNIGPEINDLEEKEYSDDIQETKNSFSHFDFSYFKQNLPSVVLSERDFKTKESNMESSLQSLNHGLKKMVTSNLHKNYEDTKNKHIEESLVQLQESEDAPKDFERCLIFCNLDNRHVKGLNFDEEVEESKDFYRSQIQYKDVKSLIMSMSSKSYSNRISSLVRLNTADNTLIKELNTGYARKRMDIIFDQYSSKSFVRRSNKTIIEKAKSTGLCIPTGGHKLEVYLEGIISGIDKILYERMLPIGSFHSHIARFKRQKHKKMKMGFMINFIRENHGDTILHEYKREKNIVFSNSVDKEIMKIIFPADSDLVSPRAYPKTEYQSLVIKKLEQLSTYFVNDRQVMARRETNKNQRKVPYKNSMISLKNTKFEKQLSKNYQHSASIVVSDDVNVICHATDRISLHSKPQRKPSRLPISFSKNSKSKGESQNQLSSSKLSPVDQEVNRGMAKLERIMSEDSEVESGDFDPNFLLSTVFGYQEVIIKSPEGLFTIFEPKKRKLQLFKEPELAQNLLNGYVSESSFSQFEESSEEEVNMSVEDQPGIDYGITPRKVIRHKTNTPQINASPRVNKILKRDQTGNMDWIPNPKEQVQKEHKSSKNKITFEDVKEQEECNKDIGGYMSPYSPEFSPTGSPISHNNHKSIKLTKLRWANRNKYSTESENVDTFLDDGMETSSEDKQSGASLQKKKSIRRKKIKEVPLKDPTRKGIQVMTTKEFSNSYVREFPRKEIGSKAMVKFWQKSDESDVESSMEEESSEANIVQRIKRGSRYQMTTPGLFIQKLDPDSDKDKKRTETDHSKFGPILQKNDPQRQNAKFLTPHSESSLSDYGNTLGMSLNKSPNPPSKETSKSLMKKFQKSDDGGSYKKQRRNHDSKESDEESHYGVQRRLFLRTCKNPMKIWKTQGFFKSMKDKAKNNKNAKPGCEGISSKKEKKFYMNLYDSIFRGRCQKLDELLKKQTINLERQDEKGNTPLSICTQIGNLEILKILIRHGASINPTPNFEGNTPLHYSLTYRFEKISEVLISNGANQLAKNNKGNTPWEGI
ncbi:unnamed protein product [Moneuplotes crassus]|uniref:Uncharacterized protein n=1 Tax=Euplotes crassus TaxID=5936 RepID=A0AAD1XK10_EUPCR|nr:unnamed protein product [Moneuplotes crassus]